MSAFDDTRDAVARTEEILVSRYAADAGNELSLVDDASALLLSVLLRVGPRTGTLQQDPETGELTGDTELVRLYAQLVIGVRALRTVRAARAVLACGYEAEARAHDRVLVELQAHRRAILDDQTGEEARAWLAAERGRGITKKVKAISPKDLYGNLSTDAHGDPRPVARLLDPTSNEFQIAPRRTVATRASLLLHAGFSRDQAAVIARLGDIQIEGMAGLDDALKTAWSRLEAEEGEAQEASEQQE